MPLHFLIPCTWIQKTLGYVWPGAHVKSNLSCNPTQQGCRFCQRLCLIRRTRAAATGPRPRAAVGAVGAGCLCLPKSGIPFTLSPHCFVSLTRAQLCLLQPQHFCDEPAAGQAEPCGTPLPAALSGAFGGRHNNACTAGHRLNPFWPDTGLGSNLLWDTVVCLSDPPWAKQTWEDGLGTYRAPHAEGRGPHVGRVRHWDVGDEAWKAQPDAGSEDHT